MFYLIKKFFCNQWNKLKKEIILLIIKIVSHIFVNCLIIFFCISLFIIINILLCYLLSIYFKNYLIGFGIIIAIYCLVIIYFLKYRKKFIYLFQRKLLLKILDDDKKS